MKKVFPFLFFLLPIVSTDAQTFMLTWLDDFDRNSPPSFLWNNSYYKLSRDMNVIEIGAFQEGKRHGVFLYFWERKGLIREETYRNGLLDGYFRDNSNESVISGYYLRNKKEGVWIHSNIDQAEKFTYTNDILNGPYTYTSYYFMEKGQYLNGKKAGLWINYVMIEEEYKESFIIEYENGIEINRTYSLQPEIIIIPEEIKDCTDE